MIQFGKLYRGNIVVFNNIFTVELGRQIGDDVPHFAFDAGKIVPVAGLVIFIKTHPVFNTDNTFEHNIRLVDLFFRFQFPVVGRRIFVQRLPLAERFFQNVRIQRTFRQQLRHQISADAGQKNRNLVILIRLFGFIEGFDVADIAVKNAERFVQHRIGVGYAQAVVTRKFQHAAVNYQFDAQTVEVVGNVDFAVQIGNYLANIIYNTALEFGRRLGKSGRQCRFIAVIKVIVLDNGVGLVKKLLLMNDFFAANLAGRKDVPRHLTQDQRHSQQQEQCKKRDKHNGMRQFFGNGYFNNRNQQRYQNIG